MDCVAQRVFEWWQDGRGDPAQLFSTGFKYRGVSNLVTGDDWLYISRNGERWTNVEILAFLGDQDWGAAAFQGLDPITTLKFRAAWLIKAKDGKVVELIETVQVVE
jgi:hypothetical protein